MTTVGYGDISPAFWPGQIHAILVMFTGVFFVAMPFAVVGGSFWFAFEEQQKIQEDMKMKEMEKEAILANAETEEEGKQKIEEMESAENNNEEAHFGIKAHLDHSYDEQSGGEIEMFHAYYSMLTAFHHVDAAIQNGDTSKLEELAQDLDTQRLDFGKKLKAHLDDLGFSVDYYLKEYHHHGVMGSNHDHHIPSQQPIR